MTRKVVIIGGGTAGTLAANRLRRELGPEHEIVVLDGDEAAGAPLASPARLVRSRVYSLPGAAALAG
jgi:cation diffusion facilitator CzcD-associated flavoprotein CzcO